MLTHIQENYLKIIYEISKDNNGTGVRIIDIAKSLNVKKPSAFKMVQSLVVKDFLIKEDNALVYLTEIGVAITKEQLNRFELTKTFLHSHLGFSEDAAKEEACNLEHVLSNAMLEKMEFCVLYNRSRKVSE